MRKQICSVAVTVTVFVSSLFGQSPASPPPAPTAPVQVKRVPGQTPPKASNQPPAVLQSYDFGDQLRVLQDPTAMDSQKSASMPAGCQRRAQRLPAPLGRPAEFNSARSRSGQRDMARRPKHSRCGIGRTGLVRLRRRVTDRRLRSSSRLHHRTAARRKNHRGAANRRFHPMEHLASRIWSGRRVNVGDRSETSGAGTRYQSSDHHGSARLLPAPCLEAPGVRRPRCLQLSG